MLPEFGQYALILALSLAIIQATLPMYGAQTGRIAFMRLSRYTATGQLLLVGFSFFALAICFLTNDFSVRYVAENSNTHLPLLYKFCAVWGAHEGSLLLWVFILSIWTAAVSLFSRRLPLDIVARVLAVMALISIGFYLFLLTTSDPFQRLLPNFPLNGQDLNPILQDPGLAIHPPMLYMGYVGFSVAFAFAIAALISGRFDAVWAKWSRPWTLVAWCFLTLGIVLGSWWSYRELGWGGWWVWDPVENASFLPWLVGTALIHSLIVTEKRNAMKAWTVLLAITAFSLSLLGTFLVRSGILISVHAFAVDPKRGLYMLKFLMLIVGFSFLLFAWRGKKIVNTSHFHIWSRETMLIANNVLLFIAMTTVLLGTLYPLIVNVFHLGKISVGAPYFNTVFAPIMFPLLFLMGVAPFFNWQYSPPSSIRKRLSLVLLISMAFALITPLTEGRYQNGYIILSLFFGFWVVINTLSLWVGADKNRRIRIKKLSSQYIAMFVAHLGMGIAVIGIVLTSFYSQSRDVLMQPGDQVNVGPYQFILQNIYKLKGPNYTGAQAVVFVKKDHKIISELTPQLRRFPIENEIIAKSSIHAGVFRDLYVALGAPTTSNAWEFRIYYKPFIRWIWAGGLFMVIGGIIAFTNRRYRFQKRRMAC